MIIYGIYDKKAEAFRDLVYADNDDLLKRVLYRMLEGSKQDYVMFPYDFAIYRLGTFEQDTGRIAGYDVKNIAFELISMFHKPDEADSSSGTEDSSAEAGSQPQADNIVKE